VAEFVNRILAAHDRTKYLRGHWIDVVALAPPLREARLLRLLRLLRLVRAFAGVYRASMHVQGWCGDATVLEGTPDATWRATR
jgi:hypothetical protein